MEIKDKLKQQAIEDEGVWCPLLDGGEVKVSAARNPEFLKKYRRAEKRFRKMNRVKKNEDLNDEDQVDLFVECIVGTVLKDWRGITQDGEDFEYNEKNALYLLNEVRDFREAVVNYSTELETFDLSLIEEIEEDLAPSSAGNLSTDESTVA